MGMVPMLDKKTISITGKRQITIPQKYYEALGFDKEAECVLRNGEIVIRPVRNQDGGEFAELILADLIAQGYSGEELLQAFKETRTQIRPAVEAMLDEAEQAAKHPEKYASYDDVFGAEDE